MARPNLSRAKILDAAAQLAASRGVSATTVDDIAEVAGVAKGSVYYSFASKEAVFETLIDDAIAAVAERMRDALAAAPAAGERSTVRSLVTAFLVGVEERPHVAKVVAAELFRTDRTWRESLEAHRSTILEQFAAALERDGEPASMLRASAIFGAVVMVSFERVVFEPERTIDECVAAVLGA